MPSADLAGLLVLLSMGFGLFLVSRTVGAGVYGASWCIYEAICCEYYSFWELSTLRIKHPGIVETIDFLSQPGPDSLKQILDQILLGKHSGMKPETRTFEPQGVLTDLLFNALFFAVLYFLISISISLCLRARSKSSISDHAKTRDLIVGTRSLTMTLSTLHLLPSFFLYLFVSCHP